MKRARGLTLVELLVTLVLVALSASLVVGGIGQGGALYAKVSGDQGRIYEELMARAWLEQTIGAAVAPVGGGKSFVGSARSLRLESFRPLLGSEGVATALEWSGLAGGGLEYSEGEQAMQITALPVLQRFEYQDADLAWHEEWPVGDAPGLPVRLRLVFGAGDDRLDIRVLTRHAGDSGSDEATLDSE